MMDRRFLLAGLAGTGAMAAARADDTASPVAHGVLADNTLARMFETVTTDLPDVQIWGPRGKRDIAELKGCTILMPLWAEWCAPCMSEIPDFARLQQKYGNDKFAIIPVLTGTQKSFTPETLAQMLGMMHAGVFEPLIEDHLGKRLMTAMAMKRGYATIPCNLLIRPDGKVMGREIGRLSNTDDADPAKTYNDVLNRTQTGAVQSRWGQADGDAFARAMADGFLA